MEKKLPAKARYLKKLKKNGFKVPDFIYLSAEDFRNENFQKLNTFLAKHQESYKVIARSAHPLEYRFKGGTLDSMETYADIGGILYARKKIIKSAKTTKALSIKRQQKFNNAPVIDLEEMGIIVMPFVEGSNVMAKMMSGEWEFGYCRDRISRVQTEPFITKTPHNRKLLDLSQDIEKLFGFPCEIEFIISEIGEIFVVQAKDISGVEILEISAGIPSIQLNGVKRIRKRRYYRERPIYVMDTRKLYRNIISTCEGSVFDNKSPDKVIKEVGEVIKSFQAGLENFALRNERFAILGLCISKTEELYQIANHYLDDIPKLQKKIAHELNKNLYQIDFFLSEADTLIAKDRFRINLCSHDAYGIDTVRYPMWNVYWHADKHNFFIEEFERLGFSTGDTIGIHINQNDIPTIYRL
ncbi:MAG: hypothetical protein KAH09_02305 [Desulfobacula sp.]|nr:hypothetical protein [Desulfobacula sp.]